MTKVKPTKHKMAPLPTKNVAHSEEVSDLMNVLKAIEQVGHKAGCMLEVSGVDLAAQEISLLEDVRTLGARAEHLMMEKMRPEKTKALEFLISKSLSKTDVECQLTLTSVAEKLEDLRAVWGQHGQLLQVTDLTDYKEMEFTFVIWSHNRGHRALLTGGWKCFCQKHNLKVGDYITIVVSNDASDEYILRAGEKMYPLAMLKCKKVTCPAYEEDLGGEAATASSLMVSGEGQDCEDTQGGTASGESRNLEVIKENAKMTKIAEDEKIAEYLFRLSRSDLPYWKAYES